MIQGSITRWNTSWRLAFAKARRLSPRASPSSKVMVNWKIWPSRMVSTLEKDHLVARVELDGRLNVLSEKWKDEVPQQPVRFAAGGQAGFHVFQQGQGHLDQFPMNGGRICGWWTLC